MTATTPRATAQRQTAGPGVCLPADVIAVGHRAMNQTDAQRATLDLLTHVPPSNPILRARLVHELFEVAGR